MASLCAYTIGTSYRKTATEDFSSRTCLYSLKHEWSGLLETETIENGTITSLYLAHV